MMIIVCYSKYTTKKIIKDADDEMKHEINWMSQHSFNNSMKC